MNAVPATETANAVTLSGIGKRYGRYWAVDQVSLALRPGERLALLGHNGAGKTTLMKLMLGLIRPDVGTIAVLGEPPGDAASPTRRAIGFLPENVTFHDAMTGRETLRFYARLKHRPDRECRTLLDRVGLSAAADHRVGTYSKGMRQRLGLAQALLGDPRLLLLDEPTTGLDPALREAFYAIISDLAAGGSAVLLSSHLLTELEERTDRIAVMNQGRLVAAGTLDQLRADAGLPIEFRLRIAEGRLAPVADALAALAPRRGGPLELVVACAPADKMAVLRIVTGLGADIGDLEIVLPGLDAIYTRFTADAIPGEVTS
ncbi:MAG: ABC transporter ATP-binding protein [Azospirillaceae bacterium]|nr:ABC transporter ATP-binding protein [Azospirillaceae bacterium]